MNEAKTPFTTEDVGYEASRIQLLDEFFKEQMDKGVIRAASYCMAKDGKIFVNKAIGTLTYEEDDFRPMQPESFHQIASITKFITAGAVFKLVEDGKMRLSQPISDFIPEFSDYPYNNLTITHLLCHTSGLGVDPSTMPEAKEHNVYDYINQEFEQGGKAWIQAALKAGLVFTPGEQWGYSSFGYTLLGEIIQRVSGQKLEDYVTKHILIPCEMYHTYYQLTSEQNKNKVINHDYDKQEYIEASEQNGDNPWNLLPKGGGGLYSTAEDLVKYGIMLMNGGYYGENRVLSRKAIEKMTRTYTKENVKDYCWCQPGVYRPYGLGPDKRCGDDFIYSPGTYGHEGAGRCNLLIDPVERFVISYFTPYIREDVWDAVPVWNSLAIMWSGLK